MSATPFIAAAYGLAVAAIAVVAAHAAVRLRRAQRRLAATEEGR